MQMTTLIDVASAGSPVAAQYQVFQADRTLFAAGLATGEYVEIQILTKDVEPGAALDGDWMTLYRS